MFNTIFFDGPCAFIIFNPETKILQKGNQPKIIKWNISVCRSLRLFIKNKEKINPVKSVIDKFERQWEKILWNDVKKIE